MADDLTKNLRAKAKTWATNITKLANRNLGKFKKLILVQSRVEEQGDKIGIISTASPKMRDPKYGYVKNVARAYEYGSGIHAKRGKRGKYTIKPRPGRKVLAFNWEVANTSPGHFIFLPDGRVIFPSVQHPGVEAANGGKGYLGSARDKVRKDIRKEIPAEVRKSVVGVFRRSFSKDIKR
jgi:hypothetical protein